MARALFLDRDGIINADKGYVSRIEDFEFVDGIFDLVSNAKCLGYLVIVITNQAGIAKGYFTEEQFHRLMNWMISQFAERDLQIDAIYYCPYHIDGIGIYKKFTIDRKPGPGMLLKAKNELNIDLESSIFVGDQETDVFAGLAAGVGRCILIKKIDQYDKCGVEIYEDLTQIRI
jgi:D-glycero-D-manno-heptose 1,7-bisphosphate phosphatase